MGEAKRRHEAAARDGIELPTRPRTRKAAFAQAWQRIIASGHRRLRVTVLSESNLPGLQRDVARGDAVAEIILRHYRQVRAETGNQQPPCFVCGRGSIPAVWWALTGASAAPEDVLLGIVCTGCRSGDDQVTGRRIVGVLQNRTPSDARILPVHADEGQA